MIMLRIVSNALIQIGILALALLSGMDASQEGLGQSSVTTPPDPAEFAIAFISGHTIRIFRQGLKPETGQLDFDYLSARIGSDGKSLVGWGIPRPPISRPSRATPVILVSLEYGKRKVIVEGFRRPTAFSVSPDGRHLAVIATNSASGFRGLQVVDIQIERAADSAIQIQKDDSGLDSYVAWSRDSREVLFGLRDQIQAVDFESGERRLLAVGRTPSWSPDGRFMAFCDLPFHLVIMDLATKTIIGLPRVSRVQSRASWSPDSLKLIVSQDWGNKQSNKNCYANSRLVEYAVPGLTNIPVLNPCSFKPELFGWVRDWRSWLEHQ